MTAFLAASAGLILSLSLMAASIVEWLKARMANSGNR
jgi:hypothetical protein